MNKHEFLDCVCTHMDHVARVDLETWDPDCAGPELSLTVRLNPNRSIWRRIIIAFRYVVGDKLPLHGHNWAYDYIILTPESIDKLSTFIIKWRLITKLVSTKRKKQQLKSVK